MFAKILIANRGEIACRIVRTARRMGIATAAVYSDADSGALHVELADEARRIGPPPARDSYLDATAIIAAAKASGAEAVHPGYGFLSENAEFADACAAAGLVFIGPPPEAIRAMGSKAAAKALMARHGVPLVPGYHGDDQDDARLAAEAEKIGFPVLIKASAGGGGRGMRLVGDTAGFAAGLAGARREAKGAFGDDRMLIERYLERPRHIEVQVFADSHGNAVHLGERDCSVQRRHQKVVEEAPAPCIDAARRQALGAAAVRAAQAVGYVGAGTVEFVAPAGAVDAFYFIEMNTRLQVEHPVTEAVTGLDLVEWQLRVAAGEALPLSQGEIPLRGHAIEVRLYAEDPARGFLPQTGTLHRLRLPAADLARSDTGVREGDVVSPFYDAMLAKIVVHGADRDAALARLRRALANTAVLGVRTNLDLLAHIAAAPEFAAGGVDTGFIERRREQLIPPSCPATPAALAAAALVLLSSRAASAKAGAGADPYSPWARSDGWRLGPAARQELVLRDGEAERIVAARARGDDWLLQIDAEDLAARASPPSDGSIDVILDGTRRRAIVLSHGRELSVSIDGGRWSFVETDPLAPPDAATALSGSLTAPMPGRVVRLLVTPGARVHRGEALMVLEAMKMEHTITAPADGVVAAVRFAAGDAVEDGAELIVLAAGED